MPKTLRKNNLRRNKTRRQHGGDECPKGGKHVWVRENPRNMGGWCKCKKCKAVKSGGC